MAGGQGLRPRLQVSATDFFTCYAIDELKKIARDGQEAGPGAQFLFPPAKSPYG